MKRLLVIAILVAQPAYAAHPDSKGDFFYKNRYTGETGVTSRLHYDKESGRMTEISNPFMEDDEDDNGNS